MYWTNIVFPWSQERLKAPGIGSLLLFCPDRASPTEC